MTEQTVLYEARGAVALVTLNRPAGPQQLHPRRCTASCGRRWTGSKPTSPIRALVITGAGRGFCAGADLAEFDFEPGPDLVQRADPGPLIDQAFNPTVRKLQALRVPTVAAVNGVAAGAGASLAMTCDLAVAAPERESSSRPSARSA